MRHVFLTGSFIAWIAVLVLMWNHRFERAPGMPEWDLATLRQGVPEVAGVDWLGPPDDPRLRLRAKVGDSRIALRLAIPEAPLVESLMLKFRLNASGLKPGAEEWETGRLMIEWHPPGGGSAVEKEPLAGIKLDEDSGRISLVAMPVRRTAVPAIVLEHLGVSGEFDVSGVKIIPVRERALWKTGRWVLLFMAFAWIFTCIRAWQRTLAWRAFAGAAICLLMVVEFAVPGPWKVQKPMFAGDFQLGKTVTDGQAPPLVKAAALSIIPSGAIQPSGNIHAQGGPALRIKRVLGQFRILLHIALLAAPTLALALLLDRKYAIRLAIPLALSIEAAQVAFGYGFDWLDVLDLIFNAAGIALGLWLCGKLRGLLRKPQGLHL